MQARMKSSRRAVRIVFGGSLPFALLSVALIALPGAVWAQQDTNLPGVAEVVRTAPDAGAPFVAEVIGNDVHLRSGPGTNYYHCGKLYKGDRVQVVKVQQGWSCIVPPPGCFSWVAIQYVSINMENPTQGIITGDKVGVYAGSDYVEPIHSTSRQVILNRGQMVKLLSEEKDDYYKIAPPEGAFLWVHSQFLQSVRSPMETSLADVPVGPNTPVETPMTAQELQTESDLLDAYYALSKLVKEERNKPMTEQDYSELKEKLRELAENPIGGRATRYADFTLKQVERFELAGTVAREMAMQRKEREKVDEKISEARDIRLAQIDDLGRFAVIGKLETTSVYYAQPVGQAQRYRILDESGRTICYVAPTGAAVRKDLSGLIGRKVGLVGEIQPHQATARAFVEFSEIVPLD